MGIGLSGRISMTFTRETASALEAIVSAVQEIRSATPNTELTETSPGSVGETDVANLVGCSRQNIRKLMLTHSLTQQPFRLWCMKARKTSGTCVRCWTDLPKPRSATLIARSSKSPKSS